jgi:transaldolase/glucose-6-phosphate isomerase
MTGKQINRLAELVSLGQSLWLDNIRRGALENGETSLLIERGDIRGITANPTIFKQAITTGADYDEAIRALAWSGWDAEKMFWELAVEDVRAALDLFAPLYEQSNGGDGYVSIEVDPHLAGDIDGTVAQAEQLWARIARPNLMVKIPATTAGIAAIRRAVAAGLNINVTLIFSRRRYAEVMEAYLSGLEQRLEAGHSIHHVASVASFFVSRVDSKIDPRLPPGSPLRGKAAIANARLAYEDFRRVFSGPRWDGLVARGARLQRPLWASTGTKDPAYSDTLYVDELVGPDTVNTLPPKTLDAARDHARTRVAISDDLQGARNTFTALGAAGIEIEQIARELEEEGVKAFADSIDELLTHIDARRTAAMRPLGPLAKPVAKRLGQLAADSFLDRFCSKDPTLWSNEPEAQKDISNRLGWMESPHNARQRIPEYRAFADLVRREGIARFLVLGMGGSSLAPEVLSSMFATAEGTDPEAPCLAILDSTDPGQVASAAKEFPPDSSLYLVSSKSGGTAEVSAAFEFFWALSRSDGSRFVAITDRGTSLEQLARRLDFRRIFIADSTVGGRFSALTDFGLVPAALLKIDLEQLVARAERMHRQCGRDLPVARSPGVALGVALAEAALAGRDKLTIVADPSVRALPHWIEQLVAESSGKEGTGILPVALEPLDTPAVYGSDRIFVYLRRSGELDAGMDALVHAGFPAITLEVPDQYAVAAEFFRWEVAIAVACHILGVNAFDQPDVQESKDRTRHTIDEFRRSGHLEEGDWDITLTGGILSAAGASRLHEFLGKARIGDYIALNAYLPRRQDVIDELQRLRVGLREQTHLAVTAGFGPRFQHSTGQFHKGGPNTGLFIQIASDTPQDLGIPSQDMSFGTLLRAQALGDYETLVSRGRRVLRVHLSRPEQLAELRKVLG